MQEVKYDELPKPQWEILKKTQENKTEKEETHQYLVKCQHQHIVKVISEIENGKVKPPKIGRTDHVFVTQQRIYSEYNGEPQIFEQTTVFASNKDGDFYNAVLYAAPRFLEVWEVMYAIGEN